MFPICLYWTTVVVGSTRFLVFVQVLQMSGDPGQNASKGNANTTGVKRIIPSQCVFICQKEINAFCQEPSTFHFDKTKTISYKWNHSVVVQLDCRRPAPATPVLLNSASIKNTQLLWVFPFYRWIDDIISISTYHKHRWSRPNRLAAPI